MAIVNGGPAAVLLHECGAPEDQAHATEERKNCKDNYSCEIIVSNGTPEEIYNPHTPNDAFVVRYTVDTKQVSDLTRGTKSKIFDMYWDKFKSGLKSIDYGRGTIKPNLWNYQTAPTKKKKRKG